MQIRRAALIIILILILLLQVGLRLPFLQIPLERDEGAYGYMAQRILAGEVPYRDAFDHKPPLVYFIYASLIKIFGNSISAIRVPTLFYSLLTTLAVFYLGLLLLGAGGGLLAAFLYALFSGGILIQGASSNTETFMVLPMLLAFIFFIRGGRSNYFWAGLFSGIAFMIKQVAVFNFIVFALTPLIPLSLWERGKGRLRWRRGEGLLMLFLGFLIPPLFFTLYFWLKGALPDYVYGVFLVNRQYLRSLPIGFWGRMVNGFYTTFIFARLENSVLWVFGIVGLFYIFIKDRLQQNLMLAFWALASLLAVATSGLFFGHYYIQLIPALCLLSAYAIMKIKDEAGLALKVAVVLVSLFLFFAIIPYQYPVYFKFTPEQVSERQYGKLSYVVSFKLAQKLKGLMKPRDKVFVWAANPELYFYLNKKAPTRYFNYLRWMESEPVKQEIIGEIIKNRPEYIVWTNYAFNYQKLVWFVIDHYQLIGQEGGWKIFKKIK